MSYIAKRQKFATLQRQKHRDEIFRKHRSNYMGEEQRVTMGETGSFVFLNEWIGLQVGEGMGEEAMQSSLGQSYGEIQRMLEAMPKWIATLASNTSKQSPHATALILANLCTLAIHFLRSRELVLPILNSLIELTSLPKQILQGYGIKQGQLAQQFVPLCYGLLRQSSNMQVILNCVYVCGNLHESYVGLGDGDSEMEVGVVGKMEEICNMYPGYSNCMEIMLWYMRSCILVSSCSKVKHPKSKSLLKGQNNRNSYFLHILDRVIQTLCSKLEPASMATLSQLEIQHYYRTFQSAFSLSYLICSDQDLYYTFNDGNGKKDLEATPNLSSILQSIDHSASAYLPILLAGRGNPSHEKHRKSIKSTADLICETMIECLFYLTNLQNYPELLPPSAFELSLQACEGKLRWASAIELCERVLEVCLASNATSLRKAARPIIKALFRNMGSLLADKQMVMDRDYRVGLLTLIQQLQDWISCQEVRTMVMELVNQGQKQEGSMWEQAQIPKAKQESIYQSHMLCYILPPLLNILQLLLIDESAENRAAGLKIVYKLLMNWQLEARGLRNLVLSLGVQQRVLEMQAEKQQIVYGLALDLIEELQLDADDL